MALDYSVLIIGYCRLQSLREIIERSLDSTAKKIYISIDAVKQDDLQGKAIQVEILKYIDQKMSVAENRIVLNFRKNNVGCAASVLSSIDWFFSYEKFGIILEDDCIPSEIFFNFCHKVSEFVNEDQKNIWLACGTQFAPNNIIGASFATSKYALTWGWCTNSERWKEIRAAFQTYRNKFSIKHLYSPEYCFWSGASRRSLDGITDVWDSTLIHLLQQNSKFSILPGTNLIENVGNDLIATHNQDSSAWNNLPVGTVELSTIQHPVFNPDLDEWLKENFYKIRKRHIFTTKFTWLKDHIFLSKRKFKKGLIDRWGEARIDLG